MPGAKLTKAQKDAQAACKKNKLKKWDAKARSCNDKPACGLSKNQHGTSNVPTVRDAKTGRCNRHNDASTRGARDNRRYKQTSGSRPTVINTTSDQQRENKNKQARYKRAPSQNAARTLQAAVRATQARRMHKLMFPPRAPSNKRKSPSGPSPGAGSSRPNRAIPGNMAIRIQRQIRRRQNAQRTADLMDFLNNDPSMQDTTSITPRLNLDTGFGLGPRSARTTKSALTAKTPRSKRTPQVIRTPRVSQKNAVVVRDKLKQDADKAAKTARSARVKVGRPIFAGEGITRRVP